MASRQSCRHALFSKSGFCYFAIIHDLRPDHIGSEKLTRPALTVSRYVVVIVVAHSLFGGRRENPLSTTHFLSFSETNPLRHILGFTQSLLCNRFRCSCRTSSNGRSLNCSRLY